MFRRSIVDNCEAPPQIQTGQPTFPDRSWRRCPPTDCNRPDEHRAGRALTFIEFGMKRKSRKPANFARNYPAIWSNLVGRSSEVVRTFCSSSPCRATPGCGGSCSSWGICRAWASVSIGAPYALQGRTERQIRVYLKSSEPYFWKPVLKEFRK